MNGLKKFTGNNMQGNNVGNVLLPPMNSPQVYAHNQLCNTPNISVYQQPKCNNPETSVEVTKRVYDTVVAEYWITDNGEQLNVGFGPAPSGRNTADQLPDDELVTVKTDSTTTGVVRDVTIAHDGYSEDCDDVRGDGVAGMNYGVFDGSIGRSYTECLTALLAGSLIIENTPFPTVIPIAAAIKTVGGYSVFYDLGGITDDAQYAPVEEVLAITNIFRFAISPAISTTHAHAPAPIEISLPTSSDFAVKLEIPNRSVDPLGGIYVYGEDGSVPVIFIWTGVVTILVEKKTSLGTLNTGNGRV